MPRSLPIVDLLTDCVQSVEEKMNERVQPSQVTSTCCPYCHHPKCTRAGWADSKWQARMDTQVEELLENPQFSDLTLPSHMEIHDKDWIDIRRKAMKLEVSRRRNDWTPVTDADIDGPSDGTIEVGSEASVNAVDRALEALAKKRGKPIPKPPQLTSGIEDPTSEGTLPQATPLGKQKEKSKPSPEQLLKMQQMAARMGVSVEEESPPPKPQAETSEAKTPEPESESKAESKPKQAPEPQRSEPKKAQPQASYLGNTPVPRGGIMVEDGPKKTPPPAKDPWAPKKTPNERVVEPHARIRLGGDKKTDE